MRLIDADKLLLNNTEILICNGSFKEALEIQLEKIENAQTVKAIPIVWIEKQIEKTTDITNEEELDVLYAGHLSYMLKLWEKENGQ